MKRCQCCLQTQIMAEIWFISDTHFNHENMITKFKLEDGSPSRPFESVQQMNEIMIQNWNARIKPQDHVWHLGDVVMGLREESNKILSRLNGKKRMLLGNHDQIKGNDLIKYFEKVELWRIFKDENFICTHVPLHRDTFRKVSFNVHGHTHHNSIDDPAYINICVEKTNYAPVHMDEILDMIKARSKE